MPAEGIRYFRVRPDDTSAYKLGELFDRDDPKAHLDAVIDLVATAAEYASKPRRAADG